MIEAMSTPSGYLSLDLLEFVDPGVEAAIGNQLDVLPAVDLARLAAPQPRIPRLHVDHLRASRLTVLQMTAPQPSSSALPMTLAFVPGGPEPMTNGIGKLQTIDGCFKSRHRVASLAA